MWNRIQSSSLLAALCALPVLSNLSSAQQAITATGAPPDEQAGSAVDVWGNTMVVGAPGDIEFIGAVYVYERINGDWELVQKISEGNINDRFGTSVALEQNTLVIGAPQADDFAPSGGKISVYRRVNGVFEFQEALGSNTMSSSDRLGTSVDIAGNFMVAGAPNDDVQGSDSGSIFFYNQVSAGDWELMQSFSPTQLDSLDRFGTSVALRDGVAIAGAPFDDDDGSNAGAAYVFRRTGLTWNFAQKIDAFGGGVADSFGCCVDTDGVRLVVGAEQDDHPGINSGSVYTFVHNGSAYVQESKFQLVSQFGNDRFGSSVRIFGNELLAGARGQGIAMHATFNGASWSYTGFHNAPQGEDGSDFGTAVALQPGTRVVGASQSDRFGEDAGATFVWEQTGPTYSLTATLAGTNADEGELFGYGIASNDDVLVVGDIADADAGNFAGAAYIYERSGSTWEQVTKVHPQGLLPGDQFGMATSTTLGLRVAVSAPKHDGGHGTDAGMVFVYVRGNDGEWSLEDEVDANDAQAFDRFGTALEIDGNQLAVGAPGEDTAGNDAGAVYIFNRAGSSYVQVEKLTPPQGFAFGGSLDLDDDRLIVGAANQGPGNSPGYAFLYRRVSSAWQFEQTLFAEPGDSAFGRSVSLDGDRALVGQRTGDNGAATVFDFDGNNWVRSVQLRSPLADSFGTYARDLQVLGDRLYLADTNADIDQSNDGAVYVFELHASAWTRIATLTAGNGLADFFLGGGVVATQNGVFASSSFADPAGVVYAFEVPATPDSAVFCTGDLAGTECPCGPSTTLGTGCPNGAGSGAVLAISGTSSVAADDLVLEASDLPAQTPAIAVRGTFGRTLGQTFGDGHLCFGGTTVRLNAVQSDSMGRASWGPNLGSNVGAMAGVSYPFQAWYRDPNSTCGSVFNLSNGLMVVFRP